MIRKSLAARWARRRQHLMRDLGASSTEWALITAAGATVAGLLYVAIQSKVLEKIGIINGA